MVERRVYKNPPIEEAVCELRFAEGTKWDVFLLGKFRDLVTNNYSGSPTIEQTIRAGFEPEKDVIAPKIVNVAATRYKFPAEDGRRMLSIAPNLLAIHILRPYERENWEGFRKRIEEAHEFYRKIFEPSGVVRVGIRYINKINLPHSQDIELDKYFTNVPQIPYELPRKLRTLLYQNEYEYEDTKILKIVFATLPPEMTNKSTFLLDIDVLWNANETPLAFDDVAKVIEDSRMKERIAFENLITERTREVFGGYETR